MVLMGTINSEKFSSYIFYSEEGGNSFLRSPCVYLYRKHPAVTFGKMVT